MPTAGYGFRPFRMCLLPRQQPHGGAGGEHAGSRLPNPVPPPSAVVPIDAEGVANWTINLGGRSREVPQRSDPCSLEPPRLKIRWRMVREAVARDRVGSPSQTTRGEPIMAKPK